jgi:PadR family transcriptional regulator, regulatory protein PadR
MGAIRFELPENVTLELRRGAIIVAVLGQLREEAYGYSLKKALGEAGMEIDEGTLYPLLRRLEGQGWLTSEWRVEGARPRRSYVLNEEGGKALEALRGEWEQLTAALGRILYERS